MDLQHVWKLREAKYLEAKEKEKKKFYIDTLTSIGYDIDRIDERYDDSSEAERIALFNSAGYLEIAIVHGKASQLLGLELGATIIMTFDD